MKNFWTSDTHDQHKNICGPTISSWDKGYREFCSLEEMRGALLEGINSTVGPDDRLFFLGDAVFGQFKLDSFRWLFEDIRCKNIVYVPGNHDDWMFKKNNLVEVEKIVGKVHKTYIETIDGYTIHNCHYSPEEYSSLGEEDASHEKVKRNFDSNFKRNPSIIYAYGHYHGTFDDKQFGIDVGVDCTWNGHKKYTPFSFEEIVENMKAKGFTRS